MAEFNSYVARTAALTDCVAVSVRKQAAINTRRRKEVVLNIVRGIEWLGRLMELGRQSQLLCRFQFVSIDCVPVALASVVGGRRLRLSRFVQTLLSLSWLSTLVGFFLLRVGV